MYDHLTSDTDRMPHLLEQTRTAAIAYLQTINEQPPAADFTINGSIELPHEGLGAEQTLQTFMDHFGKHMPAANGPRYWGFVTGGTTPASVMGDWLTSAYDLNLADASNSPGPSIEREAIALLRELWGIPSAFSGTFVSGATMSNFAGLAMGREWVAQHYGQSVAQDGLQAIPPIKVLSGAAHSSTFKALAMLGLGRRSLQVVATLPGNREAIDPEALQQALEQLGGEPCIVIANAGTVNTVDFDDFRAIAALRDRYPFWLHIDGAFGGFAACSSRYRHLVDGIDAADSITIDAHKWLNVPYDSALIWTRHRALQLAVFQNNAAYLGAIREPIDFVHLTPENSRRMRALPAWFSLVAYGRAGYREIVERNCNVAQLLGEQIATSERFRLLAPVRMNVVCFTLNKSVTTEHIAQFLTHLRDDGRVFLSTLR